MDAQVVSSAVLLPSDTTHETGSGRTALAVANPREPVPAPKYTKEQIEAEVQKEGKCLEHGEFCLKCKANCPFPIQRVLKRRTAEIVRKK